VAPYVAVAISTAIAWRSRFFSGWILASIVFVTVTNPALYFLVYLVLGGRENEGNGWTLFFGPILTWNELGAFLVVAAIVRVVQSVLQRQRNCCEETRTSQAIRAEPGAAADRPRD